MYTFSFVRIPNMKIEKTKPGELVFLANDVQKSDQHIFIYKISAVENQLGETPAEELYIAVPNGRKVELSDLPTGNYVLEQLN